MVTTAGSLGSWEWRRIVGTTFPLLVVLSAVVLVAGITLEDAQDLLAEHPVLAVMVPTMVDMGGNLGAMLSSRLSTQLHLGTTDLDPRDRLLWANVAAIFALAVSVFTALAVGAAFLGRVVGSTLPFRDLLFISLTSGLAVATIAVVVSLAATDAAYRLGIDPDDTTIPVVTNAVDVCGMLIFIGISALVV